MSIVLLDCGIIKDPLRSRSLKIIEKVTSLGFTITRINVLENQKIETNFEQISHIIISGSELDFDTNNDGVEYVREVIRKCRDINVNILGVCFGAQLVADMLGGKVVRNQGCEFGFKTVTILQNHYLFHSLPNEFDVFEYHFDSIKTIPPNATLLAYSEDCIQAFKYNNFYGIQFHPEIDSHFAHREIKRIHENNIGSGVKSKEINYTLPRKILENFLSIQ